MRVNRFLCWPTPANNCPDGLSASVLVKALVSSGSSNVKLHTRTRGLATKIDIALGSGISGFSEITFCSVGNKISLKSIPCGKFSNRKSKLIADRGDCACACQEIFSIAPVTFRPSTFSLIARPVVLLHWLRGSARTAQPGRTILPTRLTVPRLLYVPPQPGQAEPTDCGPIRM